VKKRKAAGAPGAMVVIISGPSGVGKDTIIRLLMERHPREERRFVVTYKTRLPRHDEIDGRDYNFVTVDRFRELLAASALLEASQVHGDWSGIPRDQVMGALKSGCDALLRIDVQGADKIKALIPDAVRIFVAPPSVDVQRRRLAGRGTESAEEQAKRNLDAEAEMARAADFDYVVVNETDQPEATADQIDEIIRHEHERAPDRQIKL
jgi:guanylate kinase